MYRVLCDGEPIQDLRDEELVLIDPTAILEANTAGSFEFKIPSNHPKYNLPRRMKSCVEIWHDNEQIFAGRPTTDKVDFYNRKTIRCEGQLAYLNDSIQRPTEYHNMTVRGYLETLIAIHNSQVDESRKFEVGIVTVKDNNDSLYRYTNYNSTWKEIKEDLVDDLGGYIRVRNHNGHRYIDYIEEFDNLCSQSIQFGENLLDCSRNTDLTDIATAVIPLGARLEESDIAALEKRLTVESVNNGLDYIVNSEAVANYGFKVKTVTWDDVKTPEMLLSKGKRWLTEEQFENMVIDVKAVDLHYTDEQIEQFKLFDMVPVHSTPHGVNTKFPLPKMTIKLNNPSANTFTLGITVKISLTSKSSSATSEFQNAIETIPVPSSIVQQAVDQASALITAATHGHVVTTGNEQLIMDTNDINTSSKVWRWNLNGLGYSKDGYAGKYATAITMDGQIVGERIVGNSIAGEKLDITYRSEVEKKIETAEQSATDAAVDYTDDKLTAYWTKVQTETSIKNTKDSILITAKEEAVGYTDGKLKGYYSKAQIDVKTDSITSEVNKKVNNSEFGTKITQNAYNVRVAWNNNSNFVQFENGSIALYNGAVNTSQRRAVFNQEGNHFYRDGYYVGKIGTNNLQSDSSKKGLNFDLEYQGAYMTWASQDYQGAGTYSMKWTYAQKNKGFSDYTAGMLHAGCDIDMHHYTLRNVSFENGGITGTMNFVQIARMSSDGTVASWYDGCKMEFKNGILINASFN